MALTASHGRDVCGPHNLSGSNGVPNQNSSDSFVNNLPTHGPAYRQFRTQPSRENTFKQFLWPPAMPQQPAQLAEAGFFYRGLSDNVQCFYCAGGLKNWEPTDIPWEQHALWFPNCAYLQLVKGREFVRTVQQSIHRPIPENEQEKELLEAVDDYNLAVQTPTTTTTTTTTTTLLQHGDSGYSSPTEEVKKGVTNKEEKGDVKNENLNQLVEENQKLKESKLCIICVEEEKAAVFIPCGHLVACPKCSTAFSHCPMCRTPVSNVIRTYLS